MQRDGGPGGAGGAGGTHGTSFTGGAQALELVGHHCFAYSGSITPGGAQSADTTALLFTTGNYYALIEINWTCSSTSATVDQFVDIFMNDSVIFSARAEDDEAATAQSPIKMLIPAYTKFELKVGDQGANPFTVIIAGRVYRG